MGKRTKKRRRNKPAKPYKDFPLFPHATGRWAKKIRGKHHYFGAWDDPDGALARYEEQKADLHAGRPVSNGRGDGPLEVRDVLNHFLTAKQTLRDAGEITNRTFEGYKHTGEWIVSVFGRNTPVEELKSEDFARLRAAFAKRYGPVGRRNEINKTRIIFRYAYEAGLIEKPIRFGPTFKAPSKKVLRAHRNAQPPRMFQSSEIHQLLAVASDQVQAMILLGINCGFGNADVGTLPMSALDLDAGWHDYPRPKTGVKRRAPLWPETIEALRTAIADRPKSKNAADNELVFLTSRGARWHKDSNDNPLSKEIAKLLKKIGLKRRGLNFYALRHTFETVGGETRDQVAVDYIMGHAPASDDMSAVYREGISDERLRAVTDHIHKWLFGH